MSLAAPWFAAAALAAAAAVVLLHFLARERPPAAFLPTARFVPPHPVHAPSRSARPSDLPLLLLRVAAVLLVGLALARPHVAARRQPLVRVVLVERSRAVAEPRAALDSARAWRRGGDRLVAYDSAGARLPAESLAAAPGAWGARGSLTAGLVAALREAVDLAPRADSLELVLVAPLTQESWDAATAMVRAQWQGGIRLVRVAAAAESPRAIAVTGAPGDDPVAATVALLGASPGSARGRLVRGALTGADSAFARAGGAVTWWPAAADTLGDTVGAIVARGWASGAEAVVAAPFVRAAALPDSGTVVARWADGAAAAVEQPLGSGCLRRVAFALPPASDVALGSAMRRFVARLVAPCGGEQRFAPLPDSLVARLAGAGGAMPAAAVVRGAAVFPPLATWLLLLAAAALLGEMVLRHRSTPA